MFLWPKQFGEAFVALRQNSGYDECSLPIVRTRLLRPPQMTEHLPSLSESTIRSLAQKKDVDPANLSIPLHDVIDPDALDALFAPLRHGDGTRVGTVVFPYDDLVVEVNSDGSVDIESR